MRSKTLISYQKGYCGQPADIEAMKPREARAYCLGVGHVAAGTLALGSGAEVLAALSTRRRGEGGDETTAATTAPHEPRPFFLPGDTVRRKSATGKLTDRAAVLHDIPLDMNMTVLHTDMSDNTIMIDTWWVNAEDFVLVRRAAPEPQR